MTAASDGGLSAWGQARLERLRALRFEPSALGNVTVVAYHFWDAVRFDAQFDALECALYETWRHCGQLKTRLVVNRVTPHLEAFAARFGDCVSLDACAELVPGKIHTMSVDCNANLHRRFDTDYVLIVQNDGFPIRSGLASFVGEWDFVGAPYVRNTPFKQWVCSLLNCRVSNGGFSLRSKKICELASFYWRKKYVKWPESRALSEDIFYTETLPLRERSYRKAVRIADFAHASAFSYDAAFPYAGVTPPFGFHGPRSFDVLRAKGWIPDGV
jgi:hypothetical protein